MIHSHVFGFLMLQLMRIHEFLEYKNAVFNGEQERISIICIRIEKSVPHDHTVCHHLANLLMANVILGINFSIQPSHS